MTNRGKSLPAKFVIGAGKFVWTTLWHLMVSKIAPRDRAGNYLRPSSAFRNSVSANSDNPYQPEAGRYRLYVGLSCPWAHRTLMVRTLKGLDRAISVSFVLPSPDEGGWVFPTQDEGEGCRTLAELYQLAKPGYNGRSTVPVLWDEQTKTIVNNESADIIVILNSQFDEFAAHSSLDLYPAVLAPEIERWNEKIYPTVNNGVYRCGFAQTQEAYDRACRELFTTLDEIDRALETNPYLCGDRITLADVRLFTTLIRFDSVYYGLFKCNLRRIEDYKHLGSYLRRIYHLPGVADTCNLEAIKQDYYGSLFPLNPGGIVPLGPDLTYLADSPLTLPVNR